MAGIKLQSVLDKSGSYHFLNIPKNIGEKILTKFGKRVLCIINGEFNLHCALIKKKEGNYIIMLGKQNRIRINANYGDKLALEFCQDTSPFQFEMPEELKEVLLTDLDGNQAFERISDGKKRSVIHLVSAAKRSETRINRALKIIDNLKMGITNPKEFLK